MRLVLAVLLLIGCGGGAPVEGADCSSELVGSSEGLVGACSGGMKLTCCSSSSTRCNGLTPNVWHQVPGGC